MSYKQLVIKYLDLLEQGETEKIISLFTEDAIIHSPVYGDMLASEFYKNLSKDTLNSKLKLLSIFENQDTQDIAIHFNYNWTLKDNLEIEFEVVDIIKFKNQKITNLRIIYDASITKSLFNNQVTLQ